MKVKLKIPAGDGSFYYSECDLEDEAAKEMIASGRAESVDAPVKKAAAKKG